MKLKKVVAVGILGAFFGLMAWLCGAILLSGAAEVSARPTLRYDMPPITEERHALAVADFRFLSDGGIIFASLQTPSQQQRYRIIVDIAFNYEDNAIAIVVISAVHGQYIARERLVAGLSCSEVHVAMYELYLEYTANRKDAGWNVVNARTLEDIRTDFPCHRIRPQ